MIPPPHMANPPTTPTAALVAAYRALTTAPADEVTQARAEITLVLAARRYRRETPDADPDGVRRALAAADAIEAEVQA